MQKQLDEKKFQNQKVYEEIRQSIMKVKKKISDFEKNHSKNIGNLLEGGGH